MIKISISLQLRFQLIVNPFIVGKKNCQQMTCSAYKNPLGRCWLTKGALCCRDDNGILARKFSICKECKDYKKSILLSPLAEINEKLLIIIHELYHITVTIKSMGYYLRKLKGMIINYMSPVSLTL